MLVTSHGWRLRGLRGRDRERGRSGSASGGLGGAGGGGEAELQLQRSRIRARMKLLRQRLEEATPPPSPLRLPHSPCVVRWGVMLRDAMQCNRERRKETGGKGECKGEREGKEREKNETLCEVEVLRVFCRQMCSYVLSLWGVSVERVRCMPCLCCDV